MKPYYDDGQCVIYHGDSIEVLPTLSRGAFSAVVTDPPYVIGAVSAGNLASKSGGWFDMMNSAGWFTGWYRHAAKTLGLAFIGIEAEEHWCEIAARRLAQGVLDFDPLAPAELT